jgi:SulP family sulfate permease
MQTSETLALFRYDGDLYFVNSGYLEKCLVNAVADKPQLLVAILDIEAVEQIDTTGEEMLAHMSEWFKEAGIEFYITRPKFKVVDVLKRTGLYDKIGQEHIYNKRRDALEAIQKKYGDRIDIKHLQHYTPVGITA